MESHIQSLYQPLFLYVRKRISNLEDAEDLTQEVFLKLSQSNIDNIDHVNGWVYTIAKNTITDYYRKTKVIIEDIRDQAISVEYNDDNVVQELSTCVSSYVNQLPEEYRRLMTLSELQGMPQKEIAELLDLNYVTVRSKVQRGRKKLKEIFTDCCNISQGGKGSILGYEKSRKCGESCVNDEDSTNSSENC